MGRIRGINADVNVFGCSSFQGVFTPSGFLRGAHFLASYPEDGVSALPVLKECSELNAKQEAIEACREISDKIGNPDVILMHATPGFEERVIEGIDEFYGGKVKVYGGSAGDDDISGKWFLFLNNTITKSGVLIVGFKSSGKVYGAFLSGYLPSAERGKVTKAQGRTIYEINGKPAAIVYNEWTKGSISEYLEKGGVILGATTLKPIGRVVGEVMGIKNYLLSHPHSVIPENKALTLFTEFNEGDEIILMTGYKKALIERARQVVERALGIDKYKTKLKGSILVYCAGCVGVVMDEIQEVVEEYKLYLGDAPFIGAATFGEQGCFILKENQKANKHGNLMVDNIIFG
ncbi:MAG: FIST C-terminal domain-containing protein [Spirochaetes bacterium]|nr:FIST C-terminal domain-containing protein [Spirochaetota bacterium]